LYYSSNEPVVTSIHFVFSLINTSFEELMSFQRALKELVASADPSYSKSNEEFFIGLEGRCVMINNV
jgi:hypothetical protein